MRRELQRLVDQVKHGEELHVKAGGAKSNYFASTLRALSRLDEAKRTEEAQKAIAEAIAALEFLYDQESGDGK